MTDVLYNDSMLSMNVLKRTDIFMYIIFYWEKLLKDYD
jgi:hypothetical protein